tara:strand:- start:75 stop:362 length:288 start_codon:yes stop_codon:yes gene_type:complete
LSTSSVSTKSSFFFAREKGAGEKDETKTTTAKQIERAILRARPRFSIELLLLQSSSFFCRVVVVVEEEEEEEEEDKEGECFSRIFLHFGFTRLGL